VLYVKTQLNFFPVRALQFGSGIYQVNLIDVKKQKNVIKRVTKLKECIVRGGRHGRIPAYPLNFFAAAKLFSPLPLTIRRLIWGRIR